MFIQSLKISLGLGLSLFLINANAESLKAPNLDKNPSFCNVFRALNGADVPDNCKIDDLTGTRGSRR